MGRKLRLLMSTFAIVLGVAFVAGSLVFSDTLGRSFTALFASTVGDVVVRPEGGRQPGRCAVDRHRPGVPCSRPAERPRRRPGRRQRQRVRRLRRRQGQQGGGRLRPAGHRRQLVRRARRPRAHRPHDHPGPRAARSRRGGLRRQDRRTVGLLRRRPGAHRHGVQPGAADADARRVARLPAGRVAQRRDPGGLRHADRAAALPRGRGRLHRLVGHRRGRRVPGTAARRGRRSSCPTGFEAVTGDKAADESASDLLEAISFLRTFLLIFAGISLVVGAFLIVNTFSILVAQRSRELALLRALGASKRQVTRSVLLEAFVVGLLGSTLGLGLGVLLAMAIRALFANFGLDLTGPAADLRPAHRARLRTSSAWPSPWPPPTCRPAAPPGSLRCRRCATTSRCPRARCTDAWCSAPSPSCWVPAAMAAGLFTDVPRGGYVLGVGILVVLLGVTAVSPVISRPFLAAAQAAYRAGLRQRRQPRRPELAAQPAAYDGHGVGPDDRARPGVHDGDPRQLGQGQRRPVGARRTSSATTS